MHYNTTNGAETMATTAAAEETHPATASERDRTAVSATEEQEEDAQADDGVASRPAVAEEAAAAEEDEHEDGVLVAPPPRCGPPPAPPFGTGAHATTPAPSTTPCDLFAASPPPSVPTSSGSSSPRRPSPPPPTFSFDVRSLSFAAAPDETAAVDDSAEGQPPARTTAVEPPSPGGGDTESVVSVTDSAIQASQQPQQRQQRARTVFQFGALPAATEHGKETPSAAVENEKMPRSPPPLEEVIIQPERENDGRVGQKLEGNAGTAKRAREAELAAFVRQQQQQLHLQLLQQQERQEAAPKPLEFGATRAPPGSAGPCGSSDVAGNARDPSPAALRSTPSFPPPPPRPSPPPKAHLTIEGYLDELHALVSRCNAVATTNNKTWMSVRVLLAQAQHLPRPPGVGTKPAEFKRFLKTRGGAHFVFGTKKNGKQGNTIKALPRQEARAGSAAPDATVPGDVAAAASSKDTTATLPSSAGTSFALPDGKKCHYATETSHAKACVDRIMAFATECDETKDQATGPYKYVSVDCEGVPRDLQLVQIATPDAAYVFDCQRLGRKEACDLLAPLLTRDAPSSRLIKLVHDVHQDAVAIKKFGGVALAGCLDTQLLCEHLSPAPVPAAPAGPFVGFNEFLSRLDLPQHPSKDCVKRRMRSGVDVWSARPLARTCLEYAALDVGLLQNAAEQIARLLTADAMESLVAATSLRIENAIRYHGSRSIGFDARRNYGLASGELLRVVRPHEGVFGEQLIVESDMEEVFDILPSVYKNKFVASNNDTDSNYVKHIFKMMSDVSKEKGPAKVLPIEDLSDIVLDVGRRPQCWIEDSRVFLCDDEAKVVDTAEIEQISKRLGRFGKDNRAGLDGQLHRFSAMRDRGGRIAGITLRVGRHVLGNATMLLDLLMSTDKSILILGEPGSGKTTIVREAARKLADTKNVIVVDTSNEIAGDGTNPHRCIGLARRMMVPSLDDQSNTMVECVQNHTPHVMVIDEIGRPKEVHAARTIKQRGVRMIASAHGDLRRLVKNKDLVGLVGGVESVTVGDMMAKEEAKRKQKLALQQDGKHRYLDVSKTKIQRGGEPTFEIIVEVCRESRHEWKIISDSAMAVDKILDGLRYKAQRRSRDPETGNMWMEFIDA